MSLYSKKFIKFLNEQDEDQLTDPEAMQSTLEPETDAGDFDITYLKQLMVALLILNKERCMMN